MIGAITNVREQPIQLIHVAKGTNLGGIISGTYSQTTGPSVSPNRIINIIMDTSANMTDGCQSKRSSNKKNIPIIISIIAMLTVPNNSRVLRPKKDKAKTENAVAINCIVLAIKGVYNTRLGSY